jgi:type I restriction enzyme S subunit
MTEVSVLSDRWPRVPLKHHARVVSGYPFDSAKFNFTEGTRLVRIRDLSDDSGEILLTTETVSEAEIKDGDLLIGMDGDFNLVEWRGGPAFLNQRVCKVEPRTTAVARYLFYALPTQLKAINDLTYFTTVKHLSTFDVGNIALLLPSLAEQRRIAAYLDDQTGKIDRLMGLRRRQMELLKEQRAAVMQQAVTRGLNPRAPLTESGLPWLGQIPKHWQELRVAVAVTKNTNGFVGPTRDILVEDGVRYLQSLHLKSGQIRFDKPYFVSEQWSDTHAKSILQVGDVLVVQTGDIGQVAAVPKEFEGCNCHALIILPALSV